MQEEKLNRSKRSSEEILCPSAAEETRLVEAVSRVAVAHLVAWSRLHAGHTSWRETSHFYHQINENATTCQNIFTKTKFGL